MNRIRITCPHCSQLMEVSASNVDRKLRCTRCRETFRMDSPDSDAIPEKVVEGANVAGKVIGVECQDCGERFGIKNEMGGRVVACPVCKFSQKFVLRNPAIDEPDLDSDSNSDSGQVDHLARGTDDNKVPPLPPKIKRQNGNEGTASRATVVHSSDKTTAAPDSARALKAAGLLPPTYTVPGEVDDTVAAEFRKANSRRMLPGIDPDRTRIHTGHDAVDVKSLTRQEKMRRRRIRVGVVYLFSVAVLIAWFIWLLKQSA